MKTKKLFTLAALLTSSLASAVDLADLENKYYVGLNFGGEYSSSLNLRPNLLIGYHYKKSSKLELEINSNIQSSENIGIGLLANYRYYPNIDLGPVTLYVSGGLGGYFQIIGGGSSSGGDTKKQLTSSGGGTQGNPVNEESQSDEVKKANLSNPGEGDEGAGQDTVSSGGNKDKVQRELEEAAGEDMLKTSDGNIDESSTEVKVEAVEKEPLIAETAPVMYASEGTGKPAKVVPIVSTSETASDQSSTNNILGRIAYKLKIGVDYKFTPRIIGAVGLNLNGSLNSLSQVGTGIEVGIRYNF